MNETESVGSVVKKLPLFAAMIALAGLGDAVYLTVHHLQGVLVPCSITGGCETVLTSKYAEIAGVPLAAFGAIAYFLAFTWAILAAFGNRMTWRFFTWQTGLMAAASAFFVYLQLFVIHSICIYCMFSATVCFTLFTIAVVSKNVKK